MSTVVDAGSPEAGKPRAAAILAQAQALETIAVAGDAAQEQAR